MASLAKPCRSCGGVVTVDHPQGGRRSKGCFSSGKAVCMICLRHLGKDESRYCDRCEEEGDMIALGNA